MWTVLKLGYVIEDDIRRSSITAKCARHGTSADNQLNRCLFVMLVSSYIYRYLRYVPTCSRTQGGYRSCGCGKSRSHHNIAIGVRRILKNPVNKKTLIINNNTVMNAPSVLGNRFLNYNRQIRKYLWIS